MGFCIVSGRGVVAFHWLVVVELVQNHLGKNLSELHTPLVERVDTPDGSLDKSHVLVVSNQRSKSGWSDQLRQNRGGWSVTREHLVGNKVALDSLGLDLLLRLSKHQRLGLGKEVGSKHPLVQVTFDRVVGLGGQDEVGWNELGTLVHQLEEGMLGVGGWFSKHHDSGLVVDKLGVLCNRLTIGFHGQLLQVSWESVQVLIKWCNQLGLSAVEVVVPNCQQSTNKWNVLLDRSVLEVVVNSLSTFQELLKVLETNVQTHRGSNGRPHRVSSTNPVLETKHVLGVDTELGDLRSVGTESDEVLSNVCLVLGPLQEPVLGGVCVGTSFSSGESFGSNQEQGGLCVTLLQSLGNMGTIDVGNKVHRQSWVSHRVDLWSDIDVVNVHGVQVSVSKGNVVDGSVLCGVDMVTSKHLVSELLDFGLLSQLDKSAEDLLVDQVLGEIEQNLRPIKVLKSVGELGESLWVRSESITSGVGFSVILVDGLELFPGW
ncbi:hypothetical protein OGAPHI_004365 [Ogataea philodendri]|uniref:Uncharacterized protein n=1 Tax=Ogataea philodendri TaxID=1378263 RepID=A0A9P8P6Y3_9ASCO|nr:uncharacterized protein OGAPHI_004365 [Ogataea philodendri]KAH3666176.1 hypothetical protein OGAPHI_004365 [Ogataea philodendri]